jgi:site-specific DNA-cytosine methylase
MAKRAASICKRPAAKPRAVAKQPSTGSIRPTKPRAGAKQPSTSSIHPKDEPDVSTWAVPVAGPMEPAYADHFVEMLCEQLRHLPQHMNINMWADCAGTVSEAVAAEKIADAIWRRLRLKVTITLLGACDNNKASEKVARVDRSAKHFSRDIFDRDFAAGTFRCEICDGDEPMPTDGVDVYVCCFPCSPWSKLGQRLGFNTKASSVIWQAIKTIGHMKPCFFFFENVVTLQSSRSNDDDLDLAVIEQYVAKHLIHHSTSILKGICPTQAGYPVKKTRLAIVGWRKGVVHEDAVPACLRKLFTNPIGVASDFRHFLGLRDCPTLIEKLNRVGELPRADESDFLTRAGCACGIDPWCVCPIHLCKCKHCKLHGNGARKCSWRAAAADYLQKRIPQLLENPSTAHAVTYIQALELADRKTPTSARERNLLNIFARSVKAQPLYSTTANCDISQTIQFSHIKADGTVGTMSTGSVIFSFRDGMALTVPMMAKLMGRNVMEVTAPGVTECQFKMMLGMSFHPASAGLLIAAMLGAVGMKTEQPL